MHAIHRELRRFLLSVATLAAGLLGWQPAAHASIDDFIGVYQKIESAAPPGSLPASSADIIAYKALFVCVEGGEDIVVCSNEFHQTNAGQQSSDQADIPEGVWQVVDAYVAWKAGDTWGVVEHLGAAAACAVLQVLAGGSDICGLINDLIDTAKDVVDAAKAVAQFMAAVGKGAWSAAKSVGCALHLGGCDDEPPPPPPEVSAYNQFFAPKVKDASALKARESASPFAFGSLRLSLESAAHDKYGFDAVQKASAAFVKAVYAQWSADIGKNVLPALAAKRDAYDDTQKNQNVEAAAAAAIAAYAARKADPKARAIQHCVDAFADLRHFDGWAADPQFHTLWQQLGSAPTTAQWCEGTFWYKNISLFAARFHTYAGSTYCPAYGGSLVCQNLANYQACAGLMGSVNQQAQCAMNVQHVGKDVAQEIVAYFKSKGSSYDCEILAGLSSPGSQAPAVVRCHRPTQQYHCDKYYQSHYGTGPKKLPEKVLQCELGSKLPGDYQSMEDKVWTGLLPELETKHPELTPYVAQKGPDPLMILLPSNVYDVLEADAKALGFNTASVLSSEPGIDGVEVPTLARNLEGMLKDVQNTVPADALAVKPGGVNPPDPTGKLSPKFQGGVTLMEPAQPAAGVAPRGLGQTNVLSGTAPEGAPGAAPGRGGGFAPNGGAKPVPATPGDGAPAIAAVAPPPGVVMAPPQPPQIALRSGGLADITGTAGLGVGGTATRWGAIVTVDAGKASSVHDGVCEMAVEYAARNAGAAPAGPFDSQWTVGAAPGSVHAWDALAANGQATARDLVSLRPGVNDLLLTFDPSNKVAEASETNNQFRLRVVVAGACGAARGAASPAVAPALPGVVPPVPGGTPEQQVPETSRQRPSMPAVR